MRVRTLEERVTAVALANNILLDPVEGLTQLTPGVMMFYGVVRDKGLRTFGHARQSRFIALIGEHIVIQNYEGKTII